VKKELSIECVDSPIPQRIQYVVLYRADGPDQVLIVNPSDGAAVGESMMVQPGSTTELRCAAACFPACLVAWFYDGSALSTNASVAFTPATTPNAAALSCTAANPLTGKNGSAVTTVEEPGKQRSRGVEVRHDSHLQFISYSEVTKTLRRRRS